MAIEIDGHNLAKPRTFVKKFSFAKIDKESDRISFTIDVDAVSIHKAQGLEYDSVKVIIPRSNSERITHGIFYTTITRAKKNLKIYWSSETMTDIVKSFSVDESGWKSLEIVKEKLCK